MSGKSWLLLVAFWAAQPITVKPALAKDAQNVIPFTGVWTGTILPTPQEAEFDGEFWPVNPARTVVVVPADPPSPVRLAADEVVARIAFLAGPGAAKVAVLTEDSPLGSYALLIALGRTQFSQGTRVPPHPEGYTLEPMFPGALCPVIIGVGQDDLGTYWSAQTLNQLLRNRGGRIEWQCARVRDWPAFGVRSFKVGGQNWDAIREMGRWRAQFKWNCFNVCYTTLGQDEWPHPSDDYRQLIADLCAFAMPRGLDIMPFVNPYFLWREHIRISDENDVAALVETCALGPQHGGRKVMLCLDDFASPSIPYELTDDADRKRFGTLAAANAHLVTELNARLKERFPAVELFFVPPYYWIPQGSYQKQGEAYLREVGASLPADVTVVWTGPVIRSLHICREDVLRYTELIGRKPFLWDNTLYAHHEPPSYLFDAFTTQYPEDFVSLDEKGVHYNAGYGEIYKVGLITASDYLWNPAAYEPERSLRNALAMLGGPDAVDALLAFRDAYYRLYDEYGMILDGLEALREQPEEVKYFPVDREDLAALRLLLDSEREALAQVEAKCVNERLVEELRERQNEHQICQDMLDWLAQQPSIVSPGPAENHAENPSAEEVSNGRPVGWNLYVGAGNGTVGVTQDARTEQYAATLTATEWYDLSGCDWINVALMQGNTDGYSGANAYPAQPFAKYYFSFWLKGDAARVTVEVTGWKEGGQAAERHQLLLRLSGKNVLTKTLTSVDLKPTDQWQYYKGSFITLPDTKTFALKFGLTGYRNEGAKLGSVAVDDVYVGLTPERKWDAWGNGADFNGDGKHDILWRNSATGEITVWLMDGTRSLSAVSIGVVADPNWRIVGTGDFNGDGNSDILWRHSVTGEISVWLMNGTTRVDGVSLGTADLAWKIVGVADFKGGGKPDILWHNSVTGENCVWLMNGITYSNSYSLESASNLNWMIVGAADFNGDGKPDILWRNSSTGEISVWFMNGTTRIDRASLGVADLAWKIVALADFNNDGKPDILWRNSATGWNTVWFMNGIILSSSVSLDSVTDQNWQIAP